MDPELLEIVSPKDYYEAFLKEGFRPDYRKINKPRKYAISMLENGVLVRIGNTAVICELVDGKGIEGWSDISYLGEVNKKTRIRTLVDDGNLIEAVGLAYQIAIDSPSILFPFTFSELFGYTIRDPRKCEERLSESQLTIFLNEEKCLIQKNYSKPISLADLEKLVSECSGLIIAAKRNLYELKQSRSFAGKFYSTKS
ncbi:unnamed protein product [Blepharisma stoltei]|uniref:Uncharacterized protein n=1 Tax=Blepharisma stoltei TaxID=1481888 RepID=A0AAU9JFF9_9CILI|nr:unnamed protein product [Blepharisma stoltei]